MYLQGLDPGGHGTQALMPETKKIPATRGTIVDRNGQVLAESVPAMNITADPTIVATNGRVAEKMTLAQRLKAQAGPGIIAGILATHLDGDFQEYYDQLTRTTREDGSANRYVMLAPHVLTYSNISLRQRINELGYIGLYRENAPVRSYPNGTVGANILGFMTFSDALQAEGKYPWTGGEGLELSLNAQLSGVDGEEIFESSPYGRIPTGTATIKEPEEGISYELTLDLGLQYMQDQRLAHAVTSSGARSGMAITMSVTGEVLAMSNYPTFDPNDLSNVDSSVLGNLAIRHAYEPGSVQKVLTMAALIDAGIVAPDTRVVVPGTIASADTTIRDAWTHGTIQRTATGVLVESSNVGTIILARQMAKEDLVSYLRNFGLGAPTELGLPGEESGFVPDAEMTGQTRDNISFGQGLSVTAIQEATAITAIANGGVYVSPKIIRSATTSDGIPVEIPPQTVRRVISEETSTQILQMMETVAASHTNYITLDGYRLGTKSGTAEAIDPACGCYRGMVVSYVGVAPAENPSLITLVVLDHPRGGSGASHAAPVVQDVLRVALPRYGVPPSSTPAADLPTLW
jgi:cell division protein FtsI (penicillin-binding protein 3)